MKNILYLECASGISGDMTVAALLDLGASREKLDAVLDSLHLEGYHCHVSRKTSYGLAGCDFDVHLHDHEHDHDHEHEHAHEHDHDHVHDHEHAHDHEHEYAHDHEHEHEHEHEHDHSHVHEHRNLSDVYAVIDRGEMTDGARELAKRVFRIVAEAEAKAHGCALEEVHFHEVGAVDSIVDIVAASVLLDDLGITECVVTGLSEGSGFVHCQHGDLPVPVPAVLNIAQAYGIELRQSGVRGEMVTPTGIAIAAAIRTRTSLPPAYTVERVGVGLGKRDFGRANVLRAMLLSTAADPERIVLLETNIDDVTGEALSFAMEELFRVGARDVHFMPCFMKKNRPAYLLRVIVDEAHLAEAEATIFRTTTTIGLRRTPVERTIMEREQLTVRLPLGEVAVKRCSFGELVRCYPEYESVRQVALANGVEFATVYADARRAAEEEK